MKTMRPHFWLVPSLLALSGCYVASPGPNYGYTPQGYPPGYQPSALPYDSYAAGYPGYNYNNGAPTYIDGGVAVPLVQFGGEWGYYDHERRWHRAPDPVYRDLDAHRGGGGQFRPASMPRAEPYPQSRPGQQGGQAAYRPAEQPRQAEPPHPAAAGAPVTAAPQRHEEQERHRGCPPGQRC